MVQVKQGLDELTALQLAQRAEDTATAIENNANFATPLPTPAQLREAAATVRADQTGVSEAQSALKGAFDVAHGSTDALKNLLSSEGNYVQGVANAPGNTPAQATAIIKSADMGVKSNGSPVGLLPAPQALALTQGDFPLTVDAHCHSVAGKSSYLWEKCLDGDPNTGHWEFAASSAQSSVTLSNLPSGALVWVRVSAVGTAGTGPSSAPVSMRVA